MNLANETITVFNHRHNETEDVDEWCGSVITGVSWYAQMQDTVTDKGLKAANRYTIRIPVEASTGGKDYVTPTVYGSSGIPESMYTLAAGDVIVKGEAPTTGQSPATLKKTYEMCTILGVTDNRRAPNAPHVRITGA